MKPIDFICREFGHFVCDAQKSAYIDEPTYIIHRYANIYPKYGKGMTVCTKVWKLF